jgi:hypothetical protein
VVIAARSRHASARAASARSDRVCSTHHSWMTACPERQPSSVTSASTGVRQHLRRGAARPHQQHRTRRERAEELVPGEREAVRAARDVQPHRGRRRGLSASGTPASAASVCTQSRVTPAERSAARQAVRSVDGLGVVGARGGDEHGGPVGIGQRAQPGRVDRPVAARPHDRVRQPQLVAIFATHVCAPDEEYSTGTSPNWRTAVVTACRMAARGPRAHVAPPARRRLEDPQHAVEDLALQVVDVPGVGARPPRVAELDGRDAQHGRIGRKSMSVARGSRATTDRTTVRRGGRAARGMPLVSGTAGGRPAGGWQSTRATGAGLSGG